MKALLLLMMLCLSALVAQTAQPIAITEITDLELMRQRDWCIANTYGGLFTRSDKAVFIVSQAQRDAKLKEVEAELSRRRGGAPTFAGFAAAMQPPVLPPGMSFSDYRKALRAAAEEKLKPAPRPEVLGTLIRLQVSENAMGTSGVIVMTDGSVWEVSEFDRLDASFWLPMDHVIVNPSKDINFPALLLHERTKRGLKSRQLR